MRIRQPLLRLRVARRTRPRESRLGQAVSQRRGDRPADAEIHDQRVSVAQQDVLRLDVAVDDVMGVGVAAAVAASPRAIVSASSSGNRPRGGGARSDSPSTVRHREIESAGSLTAVVQGEDVGMVQPCGDGDLAQEPLGTERNSEFRVQDLERDRTAVLQVPRKKPGPHAAPSDLALEAVAVGQCRVEAVQSLRYPTAPDRSSGMGPMPASLRSG